MVESIPRTDVPPTATLDAFVSYARVDSPAVLPIVAAAEARGRSMWVDKDDIPPGAPWRTELGTAIEAANAVVCCLSPGWLRSVECRREYDRAVELGKRLVPVLVVGVEGAGAGEVPPALAALQRIEAEDAHPADVATAVLAAIDIDPERVREHTHWLSRALRWAARDRDRSLLLRGKDLRAAQEWLDRSGAEPSPIPLQTELVAASRRAEGRRLQVTAVAALTTLAVTIALAATAVFQWVEAVSQRNQAQSRALAAAAQSQLDVDPERSLLLAGAAWSTAPTRQALTALRTSLQQSHIRVRIAAHAEAVSGVAWSPDGRTAISAGRDGAVAAWDAATGAARGRVDLASGAVKRLSAARAVAAGVAVTEQGRAVLWLLDPATGRLTQRAVLAESGVADAVVSDDGRVVAAGLGDGTVRSWTATGEPISTVRWAGTAVQAVALSADGATLLVGAGGDAFAGPVGADRPVVLASSDFAMSTVQLSADGSLALTAADDGAASVRRVTDGGEVLRLPPVFHAALDPSGRRAAVTQKDGQVDLLSLDAPPMPLLARGTPATDVRFSTDGTEVVASQLDGVTRVWRSADGAPVADLRGASGTAQRTSLAPDGRQVLTGHGDGAVHIWALPEPPLRLPLQDGAAFRFEATSVDFAPDGSTVLTAARDGLARVWDARTGREIPVGDRCETPPWDLACLGARTVLAQFGRLTRAAFSPDGRLIATSSRFGSLVVWDAATAAQVSRAPDLPTAVEDIAFSPDGQYLATAQEDGVTRIVEARTGRVAAELKDTDRGAFAVAYTPDGRSVLVAGADGLVRLWDVERRTSRVLADAGHAVFGLAVDAGRGYVAAATSDGLLVLDLADGHLVRTLVGHSGFVVSVAFAPDSGLLVSAGKDGTVRAWEMPSGDQAALFAVPGGDVADVAVDRSGTHIAAATPGGDGFVIDCEVCGAPDELARLAALRVTRSLTPEERATFEVP